MAQATDRVKAQEFVVAVREHHQGSGSEEAFRARHRLAEDYLEAEMADDAIEILVLVVIDGGRLFGPADERTLRARVLLGDAQVAGGYLYDAYGTHWNLVKEVEHMHGSEASVTTEIRAAAVRTERLLDAYEANQCSREAPLLHRGSDLVNP